MQRIRVSFWRSRSASSQQRLCLHEIKKLVANKEVSVQSIALAHGEQQDASPIACHVFTSSERLPAEKLLGLHHQDAYPKRIRQVIQRDTSTTACKLRNFRLLPRT